MQKVMIVEDDPKIADLLKLHIVKYGYNVHVVKDFDRVMDEFRSTAPDLVLLDINLPSFDGYYWCRHPPVSSYTVSSFIQFCGWYYFIKKRREKILIPITIHLHDCKVGWIAAVFVYQTASCHNISKPKGETESRHSRLMCSCTFRYPAFLHDPQL
ncbi:DNA-binding response regulator [Bacillus licheniformis]|nr:DNA-binding response regulator [Bacillus licheniformis]